MWIPLLEMYYDFCTTRFATQEKTLATHIIILLKIHKKLLYLSTSTRAVYDEI